MNKESVQEGERITLTHWEEIIAEFREIKKSEKSVIVSLSLDAREHLLQYPTSSKESELLEKNLKNVKKGTKIGILRTDLIDSPLKIRQIDDSEEVKK